MNATATDCRALCAAIADLFDYRHAAHAPQIAAALCAECGGPHAPAREALAQFVAETEPLAPQRLEEIFARTFDLNPSCAPYLSVHLFGEESFKRAILMTGLAEAYSRAGYDRGTELPDHLAVVLRFAPQFAEGEWEDITRLCLPTPLVRMAALLDPPRNPHRHVVAALQAILRAEFPTETLPCSISSSSPRSLTSPCSSCSPDPFGATGQTGSATPPCPLSFSRAAGSSGAPSPGMPESW